MRLNVQTDYALRILMTLARAPERLVSVDEIATQFKISKNHLSKAAQKLVVAGFAEGARGRSGGLRLAKPASAITVGAVVRAVENDLGLVECMQADKHSTCAFLPHCKLKFCLHDAAAAFLAKLDEKTLEDLITF